MFRASIFCIGRKKLNIWIGSITWLDTQQPHQYTVSAMAEEQKDQLDLPRPLDLPRLLDMFRNIAGADDLTEPIADEIWAFIAEHLKRRAQTVEFARLIRSMEPRYTRLQETADKLVRTANKSRAHTNVSRAITLGRLVSMFASDAKQWNRDASRINQQLTTRGFLLPLVKIKSFDNMLSHTDGIFADPVDPNQPSRTIVFDTTLAETNPSGHGVQGSWTYVLDRIDRTSGSHGHIAVSMEPTHALPMLVHLIGTARLVRANDCIATLARFAMPAFTRQADQWVESNCAIMVIDSKIPGCEGVYCVDQLIAKYWALRDNDDSQQRGGHGKGVHGGRGGRGKGGHGGRGSHGGKGSHDIQTRAHKARLDTTRSQRLAELLEASPQFKTCAMCPDQSHPIIIERALSASILACPRCDTLICGACNAPPHGTTPCGMQFSDPATREFVLQQMRCGALRVCPACQRMVNRIDGCNYMRCECKNCFCWQCGALVGHGNEHADMNAHVRATNGRCQLFGARLEGQVERDRNLAEALANQNDFGAGDVIDDVIADELDMVQARRVRLALAEALAEEQEDERERALVEAWVRLAEDAPP